MVNLASFFSKSLDDEKIVRAVTLTIWFAVLVRYAILLPELPARGTQYDFSLYYTSAYALRVGIDPYFSNLAQLGRKLGCTLPDSFMANYTPPFLVMFEPLTRLSVDAAYWVWFATSTGALIAALTILFLEYEVRGATMMVTLGLFMLFPGVTAHFYFAQSQFVLLLGFVVMLYGLRHRRDRLAGIALGLAVMFKLFPIVMAGYLLSRRRWRALAWTFGTITIGAVLLVPFFGLRDLLQFFRNNGQDPYILSYYNIAPSAFLSRVYWHLFTVHSSDLLRHAIIHGFDLAILLMAFFASAYEASSEDLGMSLWVLAMLLISPLVWVHYLPLLIIPMVQVVSLRRDGRRLPGAAIGMLLGCSLIFVFDPISGSLPHHGIGELLSEYGVAALLLLFFSEYLLTREALSASTA